MIQRVPNIVGAPIASAMRIESGTLAARLALGFSRVKNYCNL
jgi:hypothetical protein